MLGELNASLRLWIDPDRSRSLRASGDDSRDIDGEGVFRVRDSALSIMDGDFDPRLPGFRTEKNEVEDPGAGPVPPDGRLGLPDSFSRALIL